MKEKTKHRLILATLLLTVCAVGLAATVATVHVTPAWISWAGSPGSGAGIKCTLYRPILMWISWAGSPGSGACIK